MQESKFEKDMNIVQQQWNDFVGLIKQDLKDLFAEHRKLVVEIKKIERVTKLLQLSQNNIDFLLLHKESIIDLDSSLLQKFAILEAFKKRNNLSNAVAIRTFNDILSNDNVKNTINKLNALYEKKDSIDEEMDKLENLINSSSFDKDIIIKYSNKHGIRPEILTVLELYPIFKCAQKNVPTVLKTNDFTKQETIKNNEENIKENASELEANSNDLTKDKVISREEVIIPPNDTNNEFESYKEEFEKIKNESVNILNKYYEIIRQMDIVEKQTYMAYCSMPNDELRKLELGNYDEAIGKVVAMRLFNIKNDTDKAIQSIQNSNKKNNEDIEFLKVYIDEYKKLLNELVEIDSRITNTIKESEVSEDSKVFFFHDDKKIFIPNLIKQKGNHGNLLTIMKKVQEGSIQNKKGNIKELKSSMNFKEEIGKTVFIVTEPKIIVSYVKLNSATGSNDGGILILTASEKKSNTIDTDTVKIIRDNKEQLLYQIQCVENEELNEMEHQDIIRNEIIKIATDNEELKDGELNGRKVR